MKVVYTTDDLQVVAVAYGERGRSPLSNTIHGKHCGALERRGVEGARDMGSMVPHIVDGRLHRGATGEAGEVCRIPLRGRHLEYHLSTEGLRRAFVASGGGPEPADGARLADLARGGDRPARLAWETFARDLRFLCDCLTASIHICLGL